MTTDEINAAIDDKRLELLRRAAAVDLAPLLDYFAFLDGLSASGVIPPPRLETYGDPSASKALKALAEQLSQMGDELLKGRLHRHRQLGQDLGAAHWAAQYPAPPVASPPAAG